MKLVLAGTLAILVASVAPAQGSSACAAHHAGVNARGDEVMGFDHARTTHHFTLTADGGIIAVSANEESDTTSLDAIRAHLSHVAQMFAAGDFEAPMLIHDQVPPGVPVMKEKKGAIRYSYGETKTGAEIVIATADPKALAAIHDFLRFQISDHQTGDSVEVKAKAGR
jgi:hypothetical protein